MDTTAKGLAPFSVGLRYSRRGAGGTWLRTTAPPPVLVAGTEGKRPSKCSCAQNSWELAQLAGALERLCEILRQRRLDIDPLRR